MKLPAEYFNKPIIGKIITKPIAFGKQVFPPEEYDVINFKDGIYTCNQWYKEYKKVPQFIQKDMVKKFIKKNQLNDIKENKNMKIKKSILRKIIKEEIIKENYLEFAKNIKPIFIKIKNNKKLTWDDIKSIMQYVIETRWQEPKLKNAFNNIKPILQKAIVNKTISKNEQNRLLQYYLETLAVGHIKTELDENAKILKEETIENKITDLYKDIIDSFNINRHIDDFKTGTTLEFKVKNPEYPKYNEVKKYFKDEDEYNEFLQFQFEIGDMVNEYGDIMFNKIKKVLKTLKPGDWSFAGRSNGWYVILFETSLEDLVYDYKYGNEDEIKDGYKELKQIYTEFLQVENLVLNAKRKFKSYIISYIKKLKS